MSDSADYYQQLIDVKISVSSCQQILISFCQIFSAKVELNGNMMASADYYQH